MKRYLILKDGEAEFLWDTKKTTYVWEGGRRVCRKVEIYAYDVDEIPSLCRSYKGDKY